MKISERINDGLRKSKAGEISRLFADVSELKSMNGMSQVEDEVQVKSEESLVVERYVEVAGHLPNIYVTEDLTFLLVPQLLLEFLHVRTCENLWVN